MHEDGRTATGWGEARHSVRLAILLGVFFLLLGCNPIQTMAFLLTPDAIEPPKCPLVLKDKEAKVVILAAHAGDLPLNTMLMRTDVELAGKLTQLLEQSYKENRERVKIVQPSQVRNYMNNHPKWREAPPQEVGKHFGADWVINLEINSISLVDRGSANFLYHATTDIMVTVTDVHKPVGDGEVFEEPYQLEYPKSPMERTEMGMAQFRAKFIERIAKDLVQMFAAHAPREKYDSTN